MAGSTSFTGRTRQRQTRKSVKVIDLTARTLISVGGIGTILAVLGVFLFLAWVVVPLFLPASTEVASAPAVDWGGEMPLHVAVDEYRVLGWAVLDSGEIQVFRLDDGELRHRQRVFPDDELTAVSVPIRGDETAFGLADGSIQLATIAFRPSFPDEDTMPAAVLEELRRQEPGTPVSFEDGVIQLTPSGQIRRQALELTLQERTPVFDGPVRVLRQVVTADGPLIAGLGYDGPDLKLKLVAGRAKEDFLTGETVLTLDEPVELPLERLSGEEPVHLALSGSGAAIFVGWADGSVLRLHNQDPAGATVQETGRLVADGAHLTAMEFILGNGTLVWGDSGGNVTGGFPVRVEGFDGPGIREARRSGGRTGFALAVAKNLARHDAPLLSLAPSGRSRLLFCGFADGEIQIYNVTGEAQLGSVAVPSGEPVVRLAVAPKEDGFVAITPSRVYHWDLDTRHPEASISSLFRPVWYEGHGGPAHMWQSSSGTDDFEPKLGLMPLIFGTIKATLYSLLFGVPIALLAAVYTSEFLHPRSKAVVKPAIELMASLPSVVLGFLAALVFAPFVERMVASLLAGFLTLPLAFLACAYLWQLLPSGKAVRLSQWRFLFMTVVVPVGALPAILLGPALERLLFAGDLRAWLAWDPAAPGSAGSPLASSVGGWLVLCLPLAALLVALVLGKVINPRLKQWGRQWERSRLAWTDMGKFLAAMVATLAAALALALLLDVAGLDPRLGIVDTYVQRNALIVGFVMGFAIIPIIYTISEDALSTVPEHLRSASLGTGATQWQTATRVIIPTAMSGLFSAVMIGMGRAVGETMIVLMAAGNTPVMEWNVFEGFRTLSANIAVELPEAVRNSTHYRTLFLAALVLFVMTFVVNTVAEIVRLRFRKRAYQL